MSLQLITGASGSGKSYRLYEDVIKESIANPNKNYIVIVPEQFTMGTQEKIVKMHPAKGVFNVDIVSFPRLAYKVFEEMGVTWQEILDDTGKSLIVRKVLEDNKDNLTVFKKNIDKPGFVEEVKSAISEMLQYGVSVEELKNVADNMKGNALFSNKLGDMITVFEGFKSCIRDKYIASEEILEILCRVASKSEIIKGSIVTLDGFTGFTPIQYRLIGILMECCEKISITMTLDSREKANVSDGIENLFYLSKNTIQKLKRIADETKCEILPDIVMDDSAPIRLKNSRALTFLEKNIFRYSTETMDEDDGSLVICEGLMPKNEISFVAGEIKRLVAEEHYRYRDFAIVSADIETYGELSVNILAQNKIPSFLDYKRNVMGNMAVNFLRNALRVIEEDFSYESVFSFLKCGFADISRDETDLLENYCLALGVRGFSKYNSLWIRMTDFLQKSEISIEMINSVRERLVEIFAQFRDDIKKSKSVTEYCRALYSFMVSAKLEEKLYKKAKEFEREGNMAAKGEYEQVYGKIIGLLDKFVNLLGEEKISFKEFNDILDAGFGEIKVGLIPQASDAVMIGDIERTRLENVKILFFVGVNDGIIPQKSTGGGIISENDKELLKDNNIELSMTGREKAFIQKFYLYLNITKPGEKLYLSYSKMSSDGNARKMSYLLISIRKLFPKIRILTEEKQQEVLRLVRIPESSYKWEFLEAHLEPETARQLYGEDFLTSISAVERFSSCEFAHFVTYGLRLLEREKYDVNAADIGTLYHNALERFSEKLVKMGKTFTDIEDEERKALITESVMEIATDYGNTVLYSSKRNEYMLSRVVAMADRTVWAVSRQLAKGDFVPEEFEKGFVYNKMVRGRIDRIDTYKDSDSVYVKVVDYKTGESDFDLLDTYYGLKIQLITYMNAALAIEQKKYPDKKIVPAGMFYYNIKNPFIEDGDDLDAAMLEKLRVKGVVNNDSNVIAALDKEVEGGKSLVIPVSFNKDGELKESSNVLTAEKLSQLAKYVDVYTTEAVEKILNGEILVNPYRKDKRTGCDYCDFKAICGFDSKINGCNYRNLGNISDEEVFNRVLTKIEEDGNGTKLD